MYFENFYFTSSKMRSWIETQPRNREEEDNKLNELAYFGEEFLP